jgi:hypothetical protein
MSDRDPPPAGNDPVSAGGTYRPISGWAIAGFGLALLSAAGIGLFAVVALSSGIPLLFDSTLGGLLLLAFAAFGLSLVAWVQVSRDEHLRAGLSLARWGMMLSALFGLGYLSWSTAKELAVGQESRGFTDEWLNQLRHNRPGSLDGFLAFWQILPPDGRPPRFPLHDPRFEKQLRDQAGLSQPLIDYVRTHHAYGASERQRALYPVFCHHDLVELLSQAGEQAKIEAAGLRSWTYRGKTQGGFLVEQNYQITTNEGTFPVVVSALSSDTPDGRLWQVLLGGTSLELGRQLRLTPLGQNVQALRLDSREFARDWVRKLSRAMREEAFLDTLTAKQRLALREVIQKEQINVTTPEAERARLLPGFASFAAGELVHDGALLADPSVRAAFGKQVRGLFGPGEPTNLWIIASPTVAENDTRIASPWQISKDNNGIPEAVFWQPFTLQLPPELFCEGMIRVVSTEPGLVASLNPGADPVNLPVAQRSLRWRIGGVELTFGTIVAREGK